MIHNFKNTLFYTALGLFIVLAITFIIALSQVTFGDSSIEEFVHILFNTNFAQHMLMLGSTLAVFSIIFGVALYSLILFFADDNRECRKAVFKSIPRIIAVSTVGTLIVIAIGAAMIHWDISFHFYFGGDTIEEIISEIYWTKDFMIHAGIKIFFGAAAFGVLWLFSRSDKA